jgi:hypothetical protein
VPFTATFTGLMPGVQYRLVLTTVVGPQGDLDNWQTNGDNWTLSTKAVTTAGDFPPPATPAGLRIVDLGDGISASKIELIWQNTPNNEDGYLIQRSTNSSFLVNLSTFDVDADVTNYIDTLPTLGGTYYYRVAAYRGSTQSGWIQTSITAFVSPTATAISWIPGNGAFWLLDETSNDPPPFAFNNNGFAENSFNVWQALGDYRNILDLTLGVSVDPYTGQIVQATPYVQKYVGYTPSPIVGHPRLKGQGPNPTITKTFNANHTEVTVTVRAPFRINTFENSIGALFFSWWLAGWHKPHLAGWAWAQITYTINVINWSASAQFTGSILPSQTDYWNNISVGGYQMGLNIDSFLNTPSGALGPTNGVTIYTGR